MQVAAFSSEAGNLGALSNSHFQAFQKDFDTGGVNLISSASGDINVKAMSGSGGHVCVTTDASDMVAGDSNVEPDVFVIDTATTLPERVSEAQSAVAISVDSFGSEMPAMGAHAQRVVFSTSSGYLDADFPPPPRGRVTTPKQVYLFDTDTATQTLLSRSPTGEQGDDHSRNAGSSANGRYVVMSSRATKPHRKRRPLMTKRSTELTFRPMRSSRWPAPPTGATDRRVSPTTVRWFTPVSFPGTFDCQALVWSESGPLLVASQSESGEPGDGYTCCGVISADGTRVAFLSHSDNLPGGPSQGDEGVFVADLTTGVVERIAADSAPLHDERSLSISADGNLLAYDYGGNGDRVELVDLTTGVVTDVTATAPNNRIGALRAGVVA